MIKLYDYVDELGKVYTILSTNNIVMYQIMTGVEDYYINLIVGNDND